MDGNKERDKKQSALPKELQEWPTHLQDNVIQ